MLDKPKVLIVDDEVSIRHQLLVGLVQRGFEVEDCEDGFSALEKIEKAKHKGLPYNYIITDICLPDIDGLKLLELIKSKYPSLPVVVISGYGDKFTRENVEKQLGGSAYLDKPFEVERLESELKRIGLPAKEGASRQPKKERKAGGR